MNLDDRIRQSIERHTADPGPLDAIPEGLLRRARRRIALTVAGAVLSVAVLGGGSFLLVRSFGGPPAPEPGDSPTLPEATATQAEVREFVADFMAHRRIKGPNGEDPLAPNAPSGAEEFLSAEAKATYEEGQQQGGFQLGPYPAGPGEGWDYEIESLLRVSAGSFEVIARVDKSWEQGDRATHREILSIGSGTRYDGTAAPLIIRSVVLEHDGRTLTGIEAFMDDFMQARVAGSGAEAFLSPEAEQDYAGRRDGFRGEGAVLYGNEERPIREYEIQAPREIEGGLYEVFVGTLRGEIGDTPPCPFTENLLVDPRGNDGEPLIISSVENPPGTLGDPITALGAHAFACVFMDARASGAAMDHLLSPHARDQYASGEGGLDLRAPEQGFWWVADVTLSDAEGSIVTVAYRGADPEQPEYEQVTIAPGTDANGEPRQAVIGSARMAECEYDGTATTCT
jgi:hypothetical protein